MSGYMTVQDDPSIKKPKAIYTPNPAGSYQTGAASRGVVMLWVGVGVNGRVERVQVRKSLEAKLDQRAIDTVYKWRFKPATLNGKLVAYMMMVDIAF